MIRTLFPAVLLPVLLLCGACQPAQPMSKAARADYQACRARADQVYNQQNRAMLSERDTRDAPFATSGLPGITSAGLSSRYSRDSLLAGCTGGAQPVDNGTGPTFAGPASVSGGTPTP